MLTKSEAAFRHQVLTMAEDYPHLYFWTVTFYGLHSDWEAFALFGKFLDHLQKVISNTVGGVRMAELHKQHGVHFHLVVNERLAADLVRRVGRCYGIGRVNVKVVHDLKGAIDYLAKYLSKQRQAPKTEPKRKGIFFAWTYGFSAVLSALVSDYAKQRNTRRWASFGKLKRRARVIDMENASDYWLYRKAHNLPWQTWRAEFLLRRAWLHGEQCLKTAWFQAKQGFWRDVFGLATGKATATGLGEIVWRSAELESCAPF